MALLYHLSFLEFSFSLLAFLPCFLIRLREFSNVTGLPLHLLVHIQNLDLGLFELILSVTVDGRINAGPLSLSNEKLFYSQDLHTVDFELNFVFFQLGKLQSTLQVLYFVLFER